MRSNLNISNNSRQVVNKQILTKVTPIEKFKKELFKLSKGNGKENINHALKIITTIGRLNKSQEEMRLYLGVSVKSVNRALQLARKLKILSQEKTQHFWDHRKRGKDIHFLGSSCFNLEKLEAIIEVFPILKNYYETYRYFIEKKGLMPSKKLGVNALKSILNNKSLFTSLESSTNINKEAKKIRRNVCEKWTPDSQEKAQVKIVKRTEEEMAIEQNKLVKFFCENKFSRLLPPDVMNSITNKASNNIASHKYV